MDRESATARAGEVAGCGSLGERRARDTRAVWVAVKALAQEEEDDKDVLAEAARTGADAEPEAQRWADVASNVVVVEGDCLHAHG